MFTWNGFHKLRGAILHILPSSNTWVAWVSWVAWVAGLTVRVMREMRNRLSKGNKESSTLLPRLGQGTVTCRPSVCVFFFSDSSRIGSRGPLFSWTFLPNKNCVFFHSYVTVPVPTCHESGKWWNQGRISRTALVVLCVFLISQKKWFTVAIKEL